MSSQREETTTVSMQSGHGELKRYIAQLIGADPERYSSAQGSERHKRLTIAEVDAILSALGLEFVDGNIQTKRDTIMLKLGRDHRTGFRGFDSSDLVAIVERLEGGEDDGE